MITFCRNFQKFNRHRKLFAKTLTEKFPQTSLLVQAAAFLFANRFDKRTL
jgi:hypothetical protein